jgi:iron complex outermembrane receptor protein
MNGIPLNDSESQGVFWVNMPDFSSSVDNVQIQRGVGTSTQGAAAFGATVNFQTGDLNKDPYGEYHFLAGSFNTLRHTLRAGSGLIADHFTLDARVSKLNTDGYIDYSGCDHRSIYATGAYHAKKSLLRFTFLHGNEKTGISWWGVPAEIIDTARTYNPAGVYYDEEGNEYYYENQTDNYKQTHYQLHFAHSLNKEIKLNAAAHYTQGAGYYEQYQDDENAYHTTAFSDYGLEPVVSGPDTFLVSDLARQKWLDNDFFGLMTSANYRKSNYELTAGFGWNKYLGDHFGEIIWIERMPDLPSSYQWYLNEGKKSDWNIFAKANYILNYQITFFGDLQFRHIKYTLAGTDDDLFEIDQEHKYNFLNPKAGIFYNYSSNHKAWASIAIAHREPTRANFKEAKGDPDATPQRERLFDIEAGYRYSLDKLVVGANLYNMRYKDQLIPTGEKSNVGYDIMTNVEKSYRRGIEIEVAYLPLKFLRWDVNLTLSSNKIKDYVEYATHYSNWNDAIGWYEQEAIIATPLGKTHIAYSPSLIGTSILDYEFYPNAHISLTSKFVGRQYFDNTSSRDRSIDPYFINDLKLDYKFSYKFFKQVSLMFQINNLFNVKYINNAYGGNWYEDGEEQTWAYYYPQAGFHFFTGLKIGF